MKLRGDLQSFPLAQLIQTLDSSQRSCGQKDGYVVEIGGIDGRSTVFTGDHEGRYRNHRRTLLTVPRRFAGKGHYPPQEERRAPGEEWCCHTGVGSWPVRLGGRCLLSHE